MHQTDTPLFAIPCFGATIAHVHVFPTYIRYQQKWGKDITVAANAIASVEKRVHAYGYLILTTTSRRRIICMLSRNRAHALYKAIRRAQQFAHV
jgi:hypothetical protein